MFLFSTARRNPFMRPFKLVSVRNTQLEDLERKEKKSISICIPNGMHKEARANIIDVIKTLHYVMSS